MFLYITRKNTESLSPNGDQRQEQTFDSNMWNSVERIVGWL